MLTYLSALLPTFVGGMIGFVSARLMLGTQAKRQRRNVAQGILLELRTLEKPLIGWGNVLRSPPDGGLVRIDTPLYPSHGLFHTLKKDILLFDHVLAEEVFAFYIGLLEVEEQRKFPTNSPAYPLILEGVATGVADLNERLPRLRRLLLQEVERSARRPLSLPVVRSPRASSGRVATSTSENAG